MPGEKRPALSALVDGADRRGGGRATGRGSSPATASACAPARWSASTSTSSIPTSRTSVDQLVRSRLGDTLMRVGRWPKRLLLYRTDAPFAKMAGRRRRGPRPRPAVRRLRHPPDTGQPYDWPLGETPLDVPFDALPLVDAASCAALLGEIAALLPPAPAPRRHAGVAGRAAVRPARRARSATPSGRVVDGRDGWLSTIAYHAVHDAVAAGGAARRRATRRDRLGALRRHHRPRAARSGTARAYALADAARKVADKLRLLAEGRLPPRDAPAVEADYQAPTLSAAEARATLDALLADACDRIEAWHAAPERRRARRSASGPPSASARAPAPAGSCSRCASA